MEGQKFFSIFKWNCPYNENCLILHTEKKKCQSVKFSNSKIPMSQCKTRSKYRSGWMTALGKTWDIDQSFPFFLNKRVNHYSTRWDSGARQRSIRKWTYPIPGHIEKLQKNNFIFPERDLKYFFPQEVSPKSFQYQGRFPKLLRICRWSY